MSTEGLKHPRKLSALFLSVLGISLFLLAAVNTPITLADLLQQRSVTLTTNISGQTGSDTFRFNVPDTTTIGAIRFEYCANSPLFSDPCDLQPGLDASGASILGQSGNTGFSIDPIATNINTVQIDRAAAPGVVGQSVYNIGSIHNPSGAGETTFVRISIFSASDGSGFPIDTGAVAFVTSQRFTVSASVPPFMQLCVGITVAIDCSTASGNLLDLGNLSIIHANVGQSQFSTGTNSLDGYAVYALGNTMTSGNNIIPSLPNPSASIPGTDQFGINLRGNSSPVSGQDPDGDGLATPVAPYDTPNQFVFNGGDMIVQSSLPTDYNRMTVSYLVNINNSQPIGNYSATLTYLAVATF